MVICQFRGNIDITDWELLDSEPCVQRWRTGHNDKGIVPTGLKDETWLSVGSEVIWTKLIEKPPSLRFLPFRGDKLDITVKEIIPSGEIRWKIDISFGFFFGEEIVRGVLLT